MQMDDKDKAAIEAALGAIDAHEKKRGLAGEAWRSERQALESAYRVRRDNVIIPAFKEFSSLVEPLGWRCQIQAVEKDIAVAFEFSKDASRGKLSIHADLDSQKAIVESQPPTTGDPAVVGLSDVTPQFINARLVEMLKRWGG